jgi:AIR synthase-related protein
MDLIDSPPDNPMEGAPSLEKLVETVMAHSSVQDKLSIHKTYEQPLDSTVNYEHPFFPETAEEVRIGDDCAALSNGHGGHQLFAAEGILPSFVQDHPWFAGYSSVMVNLSDVCAMGGRPTAVVNMLWIQDQADGEAVWAGMNAASEAYDVPIVGGHTTYRCEQRHLGVAVTGQARTLLTSYDACPGDVLLMSVDLNGHYADEYPFWNASTEATPDRLQRNLGLMNEAAERGWAKAAKDVSMGGVIGTLAMLLHTSEVGATLRLEAVPRPQGVDWEKWLVSFPSYGFLLTAEPGQVPDIQNLFWEQDVACEVVGEIQAEEGLRIRRGPKQVRMF